MNKPGIFCEDTLALNQLELLTPDTMVLPVKHFTVSDVMQFVNLHLCKSHGKTLSCVPRAPSVLSYPRVSTLQKVYWVIGFTAGEEIDTVGFSLTAWYNHTIFIEP